MEKEDSPLESSHKDPLLADYDMLIQSMYLTKYIAESQSKDLSKIEYSPLCKKLYTYKGSL